MAGKTVKISKNLCANLILRKGYGISANWSPTIIFIGPESDVCSLPGLVTR